jgi:hypothetical protein
MHEDVEQGPFIELFIEHDHVEKRHGVDVADLGRLKAEGPDLGEEPRRRHPHALEFEDARPFEECA